MNEIRYSKDSTGFAVELREKVKDYFRNRNLPQFGSSQIIIKTLVMATVYLTPFILMLSGVLTSLSGILTGFFIMGLGLAGMGMGTMHDANHGSFSGSRSMNSIFGMSLYLLGGFPANWKIQHNIHHHGFTNIDGHDEDIAPMGLLRFSPHQPRKRVHRYQHLYAWAFYCLMTVSWVMLKDFKRLTEYQRTGALSSAGKSYRSLLTKLVISKLLYYILFMGVPMWLLPVAWYWVLAGFMLMHLTAGLILSVIFQTAHVVPTSIYPLPAEGDRISTDWSVHQLFTTCDFSPGNRVFSWFIGGLNYQVIHHLFPNISHVHYKRLAPIVQQTARKYNLPYHVSPSFSKAVGNHYLMLKKLGRQDSL